MPWGLYVQHRPHSEKGARIIRISIVPQRIQGRIVSLLPLPGTKTNLSLDFRFPQEPFICPARLFRPHTRTVHAGSPGIINCFSIFYAKYLILE
jgi:hypothetical protein